MLNPNNKDNTLSYIVLLLGILPVIGEVIYFGKPIFQPAAESAGLGFGAYKFFWGPNNVFAAKGFLMRIWFLVCIIAFALVTPLRKREIKNINSVFIFTIVAIIFFIIIPIVYKLGFATGTIIYLLSTIVLVASVSAIKAHYELGFHSKDQSIFKQNTVEDITKYSVNFKTAYSNKRGRVNVLNPFSGTYIVGGPGSGKSFTLINEYIIQLIKKGFSALIYDFKAFDLGRLAYNVWLEVKNGEPIKHQIDGKDGNKEEREIPFPEFYSICFNDLPRSHRCNCVHQSIITSTTEAITAITSFLLNLNPEWIKNMDFWAKSARSLAVAEFWFLRKMAIEYNIEVCSIPHLIALNEQKDYMVIDLLMMDNETKSLASPIAIAYQNGASEQLAGQWSSLSAPLSNMAQPSIFWVMSGNDFPLDINNPERPIILVLGNDSENSRTYGPALSLYATVISKKINVKGRIPCLFEIDEAKTIYVSDLDQLPNTGRSNKIAVAVATQDDTQMDSFYGDKEADNLRGGLNNVFVGQLNVVKTAEKYSKMFGKRERVKKSYSDNEGKVSVSTSTQLQDNIEASDLMTLNVGEFGGKVTEINKNKKNNIFSLTDRKSDNDNKEKLFYSKILIDTDSRTEYTRDIPQFNKELFLKNPNKSIEQNIESVINDNYHKIKEETKELVEKQYWLRSYKNILETTMAATDLEAANFEEIESYIKEHWNKLSSFMDYQIRVESKKPNKAQVATIHNFIKPLIPVNYNNE